MGIIADLSVPSYTTPLVTLICALSFAIGPFAQATLGSKLAIGRAPINRCQETFNPDDPIIDVDDEQSAIFMNSYNNSLHAAAYDTPPAQ